MLFESQLDNTTHGMITTHTTHGNVMMMHHRYHRSAAVQATTSFFPCCSALSCFWDHGWGQHPFQISCQFLDVAQERCWLPWDGVNRQCNDRIIKNTNKPILDRQVEDISAPLPLPPPPLPLLLRYWYNVKINSSVLLVKINSLFWMKKFPLLDTWMYFLSHLQSIRHA